MQIQQSMKANNRYVICLKYGNKYSADYVNRLNRMVRRNLTLPYEFVCFTEDSTGLDPEIRIEPLANIPVVGWWFKPMFFDPEFSLKGTVLFLDLDLVIFNNINYLFSYNIDNFCIIRDFNRHAIPNYNKFNSSVFRLNTGQHSQVYTDFLKNIQSISKKFQGDQDWMRKCIDKDYVFWPDDWIQSYKWEMRSKPRFNTEPRGQRDFAVSGEPVIKPQTSIAVFHGDPNPHICKDPWVIKNWR